MKISKIKLVNFRQYDGEQTITFATENKSNVTVIHGSNGAGKTALLNAFKWGFYGDRDSIPNDEPLCFRGIIKDKDIGDCFSVKVEIEFEHEANSFLLERSTMFKKVSEVLMDEIPNSTSLTLSYTDETGRNHISKNPKDQIRQILPEDMHPYFFFNGEDINRLGDTTKKGYNDKIQNAIKNLMELTIVERGINHLETVSRGFRREMASYASDEAKVIEQKITNLEENIQDEVSRRKDLSLEVGALENEMEIIGDKIKKIGPLSQLETSREECETNIRTAEKQLESLENKCKKLIQDYSALPFIREAIDQVQSIVEDKRKKKDLPIGIRENFINDILLDGICICGREIKEGSAEYEVVKKLLEKQATPTEIESTVNSLMGHFSAYDNHNSHLREVLGDILSQECNLKNQIKDYNEKLSEISAEIKRLGKNLGGETEDPVMLEARRETIRNNIKGNERAIGGVNQRIEQTEKLISKLKIELKKAKGNESKTILAETRYEAVAEAANTLKELNKILIEKVKVNVSDEINNILHEVTNGYIKAEVTDRFELKTFRMDNGQFIPIAKSTGQNQVTSLAFISSLAKIAKDTYNSPNASSFMRGGEFPLVMDSPFGSLDENYGPKIAEVIPQLTSQVIVIASEKQLSGDVENFLRPYIGKEHVLTRFEDNPKNELTANILGTQYDLIKKAEDKQYTKVTEVL